MHTNGNHFVYFQQKIKDFLIHEVVFGFILINNTLDG